MHLLVLNYPMLCARKLITTQLHDKQHIVCVQPTNFRPLVFVDRYCRCTNAA